MTSPNEVITDTKLLRKDVQALKAAIETGAGTDAINPNVITGKGDIVVGTGAATPGVISPGPNGQVLTADSTTSTGLKWAAPSGGTGTSGVSSVNGRTGDVNLSKTDVGLASVDNTSDLDKPVSLAMQAALDAKASSLALNEGLATKANSDDVSSALATKESLSNKGASGGYASLNSATRVVPAQIGQAPVVLTDATVISTNASLSNQFRVTLAGDRTLDNPTNPFDGQVVMWSIKQDGVGSRMLTLGSKFRFGTDITSIVLSTAAGKTDKLGAQYNAEDDRWDVVSFVRGF